MCIKTWKLHFNKENIINQIGSKNIYIYVVRIVSRVNKNINKKNMFMKIALHYDVILWLYSEPNGNK